MMSDAEKTFERSWRQDFRQAKADAKPTKPTRHGSFVSIDQNA
jgi:hypothetical protein